MSDDTKVVWNEAESQRRFQLLLGRMKSRDAMEWIARIQRAPPEDRPRLIKEMDDYLLRRGPPSA